MQQNNTVNTRLLTVVVPVLNEISRMEALMSQLNALPCPIIVVDGGSTDGSYEYLHDSTRNHISILSSEPGRAVQMNLGASRAASPYLLFLHADTRLPYQGVSLVIELLESTRTVWGRFDITFDDPSRAFKVIALCMNWRSAFTGICTGDQAIFLTAEAFRATGGFPQIPLMEDIELSRQMKKSALPARIRTPAITSARRWRTHGIIRTVLKMWWIRLRYQLGVSVDTLAQQYDHAR